MAIAFVASAYSNNYDQPSSYTSTTGTLSTAIASVPANSLVVVAINTYAAITSASVTDTGSLTWKQIGTIENSSSPVSNAVFYAVTSVSLTNWKPTIHVNGGYTDCGLTVSIFSGVSTSNPLGGHNQAAAVSSAPAAALTPVAGSLVYANINYDNQGYLAPGTGYTAAVLNPPLTSGHQDSAFHDPQVSLYNLSSTTAESPGGTIETSTTISTPQSLPWTVISAWFNADSGGTAITEPASGTAAVAGSGTGSYGFEQAASGGMAATGQAGAAYGYDEGSAGIVQSSGASVGKYGLSESSAGVVQSSGAPSAQYNFTAASGGAFSASGSTAAQYGFIESASGTAQATGTAQPSGGTNYVEAASGIADVSGQAVGQYGFRPTAAGPVAFYGQSIGAYGFLEESTGPAATSGVATGTYAFLQSAAGASLFTGSAPPARRADAIKLVSYSAMLNVNMATLSAGAKDKMTVSAQPNVSLRVLP